jgi:hypothetical protein
MSTGALVQLEIPMPAQPAVLRMKAKTHAAILRLRQSGFTVRREGRLHRVRPRQGFPHCSKLLSTMELLRMEWEIGKRQRAARAAP